MKKGNQYQRKGMKMNMTKGVMFRGNEMNHEGRQIQENKMRINDDEAQWIKMWII